MENTITENKPGYKKTKLGWIPEDWENSNIGSEIKFTGGSQPPRSTFVFEEMEGYTRLIQTRDYRTDRYKTYVKTILTNKFCDKDDIMIGRYGPPIFQIFRGLKGAYNVALIKAEPKRDNLFKEYLWYFLNRRDLRAYLESLSQRSGGQTGVEMDLLKTYHFPLPPLPEQKAIANCLSTWDTAITKLDALIKAKQKLKKALMQQLLSGKKRLPGFVEEWEGKRLDFFFNERSERNNLNLPLLSIGEAGVYPQDDSNKKDTSNSDKSKYKKICVGDIGYNTMRMWQGRSALSGLEGIVSPAYTIVKPKNNTDSKFFAYLFKDPAIIHRFYRNSQGMVSDTLNCKFKDFAIIKLMLPTNKSEQTAIAQVLNTADEEINLLTAQRKQLQLQKKGLMQQLLTGKKRLKTNG
ncbi:restriction endonuclease subunit S [Bizionia paragorgiae]|uniref:Type I restriction modification DNA specificity domain-containing protein n=1 Tax=Bizionia paragorgiae TaxID=283786 RepID=A0A1H4B7L6_BIZPA|nr:restriction endonuclease subunit S [Bizionia paragorgiae]SEA43832.1 Type I restriction modification DNA specificity domain-containing protein [Bizionia paragorgiae]